MLAGWLSTCVFPAPSFTPLRGNLNSQGCSILTLATSSLRPRSHAGERELAWFNWDFMVPPGEDSGKEVTFSYLEVQVSGFPWPMGSVSGDVSVALKAFGRVTDCPLGHEHLVHALPGRGCWPDPLSGR